MTTENQEVENLVDDVSVEDDEFEVVVDDADEGVEVAETPDGGDDDDDDDADAVDDADESAEEAVAEADEAPAETVDDDAEDAELASMPAKFKKRLTREIRLREQIISEREQIKSAAVQVAQIAQQRESEVVTLKKQNAALQRQFAETLDYAYERDINLKAATLRRAREDGDYDAELKIQGELDTLRFQQNQVRQAKASLPDPETVVADTPAPAQQASQQQEHKEPPAPLALKWLDRNKTWFGNPKFAGHRAFALAEDQKLVAEGYDKQSPEYYKELDRRIDGAFPALRKKPVGSKSPVAPATNSPARNLSSNVVKLTKADLSNMRMFGLDPSNKEHLREYARNKRSA